MLRLAIRLLYVGAALTAVTAAEAQPRERQLPQFDERYYREDESPQEVEGTIKMCSVYVPNQWRDTIPVPANWRWSDCRDFAAAMGASHINFVCAFTQGSPKFSVGGPGDLPEPNCGWGRQRR